MNWPGIYQLLLHFSCFHFFFVCSSLTLQFIAVRTFLPSSSIVPFSQSFCRLLVLFIISFVVIVCPYTLAFFLAFFLPHVSFKKVSPFSIRYCTREGFL